MIEIFVEGNVDKNFINHIIVNILKKKNQVNFNTLNGWGDFINLKSKFNEWIEKNIPVMFIFDADNYTHVNGGYNKRKNFIDEWIFKNYPKLKYSLFLFPNNKDQGEIEDLLLDLITEVHKHLKKCFNNYVKCLENENSLQYKLPSSKDQIYAIISALENSKLDKDIEHKKKGNYYFDDENIWNYEHSSIIPLFNFINDHIK